jgi:hypothetical protein
VKLWTAVDMTGTFVTAGVTVQVCEMAAAGGVLGAFKVSRDRRRLSRRILMLALLAAVAGILLQNLTSG